ncbi:hypothetical protein GLW04_01175 [Halobacillus litoralis]|uniref:Uncharacterized protein n=1 Tax=Halobacillus litoralis TaxID=45668 RepID=A0A845DLW0_9BACI|nr:hypothetical protein [Halobacillus litoralis]MYL18480.1 hypothetical protein [Halobacillus litoralis]
MGYIIPVNHYQYLDYQIRVVNRRQRSFAVDKIVKAGLDTKLSGRQQREEECRACQRRSLFITSGGVRAGGTDRQSPGPRAPQTMGEKNGAALTGKGSYFSETV